MIPVKRDELAIMADLLDCMQSPQRVTHILNKTNISYSRAMKYINKLKDIGLAEENPHPFRTFQTTDNGLLFMGLISENKPIENTA